MSKHFKNTFLAAAAACAALSAGASFAQPAPGPLSPLSSRTAGQDNTDRIVVKFRQSTAAQSPDATAALAAGRTSVLASRIGQPLAPVKTLAASSAVYQLAAPVSLDQARALAAKLAQDPAVLSAEPDVRTYPLAVPTDPLYAAYQWSMKPPVNAATSGLGGANFEPAWDWSHGANVAVAVLDTGSLTHRDLQGAFIGGYDFVSSGGNDGDGRDADPSDPGDYCAATSSNSSWHGLKVASQIAARTGDSYALTGGSPGVSVVPVRVLGTCGGYLSDAAEALNWLAGLPVAGVPANSTPVRVANLSLGGGTTCPSYMQDAVSAAVNAGIVVVAAAGNGGSAQVEAPAVCSGAIAVGAHTRSGDLAGYSNYDPRVTLTAPGGGSCKTQTTGCQSEYTIASSNNGTQGPTTEHPAWYFNGTSSATPHVAAAAALMLSLRPHLSPAQVKSFLTNTARPHPAGTFCAANPNRCGAGMLDAGAAVAAVTSAYPTADIRVGAVSSLARRNQAVALSAQGLGATDYTWAWAQVSGPAVSFSSSTSASPVATTAAGASGIVVLRVTGTSASLNESASADVSFRVDEPPVVPGGQFTATPGVPLTISLGISDAETPNTQNLAVSFESGNPTGLSLGSTANGGELNWVSPDAGQYSVVVVAQDAQGQLTRGTYALRVGSGSAPTPGQPADEGGAGSVGFMLLAGLAAGATLRRRKLH